MICASLAFSTENGNISAAHHCFVFAAGLESEGLYRMAGFHDDVEAIKICFDKGESKACLLKTGQIKVLSA